MHVNLSLGYGYWVSESLCQERKQDGGDDGSRPEPIPFNSKLWHFFLFPLIILRMSFNIDFGVVINGNHRHLRGEGGEGIHQRESSMIVM